MSWNGSENQSGEGAQKRDNHRSTSNLQPSTFRRGILAGLIVIAGGLAAMWYFNKTTTAERQNEKHGSRGKIAAATPAAAPTNRVAKTPPKKVYKTKAEKDFAETNGMNSAQLAGWWIANRPPAGYTNDYNKTHREPYEIFNHRCDNSVAFLLTYTPGDLLIGDMHYETWFTKAFLKSLETPIVITKDDTEEQAELKRMVIETKKELKARHDAGEDIAQIMTDARKELQKMAAFKKDLTDQLYEMKHDGTMTDENMQDYVDAANKMLDAKGIAPLKFGPLMMRNLRLKQMGGE